MSDTGIVAVVPGDPDDALVWSGSSRHLLEALRRRGALRGAVDGAPAPLSLIEKAGAFDHDRARWRQRYWAGGSALSPLTRRLRAAAAGRALRRLDTRPDAIVQIGGWCDASVYRAGGPALRAAYFDGNLATFLRRPELRLDASSRAIRRAWDAERRLYDRLDLIMTMSNWLRRSFLEDFEQDERKVVAIGGGANLATLPDPPAREPGAPRLLFVGKGDFARKGGPDVLEAFRAVRAEHPDAELWVVGQSPRPDAPEGVRFMGRILRDTPEGEAAIDRVYREASVFVMPSRYEPFGIAFLEAMAYGLPCVAADACAMPEIVADGETGRVVPYRAPDRLAEALLEIAADPERGAAMGAAGRRRLEQRYTWDAVAAGMAEAVAARR